MGLDLKQLCVEVQQCVLHTAEMIRKERAVFNAESDIQIKGHSDFVTNIDKLSEERLVSELSQLLPEAGFLAEEGTSTKKGELYNWVIDPIDGTTNFIHGLAPHAISIALMRADVVVMGIVYEIAHGELFYAWEGSLSYLNHKVISVSGNREHQNALVATGFHYSNFNQMDDYLLALREIMEKSSGIRRLGSAAIDLCYVACGRFEAFWEYGLHPWDVAAGILIVKQAGGKVSDFSGTENYIFNSQIIATNANYFGKFYEIVNKHLGNKP
jgi:myo-inositol-1(or 4)-monophosphatase